jgi:hypothetical protein
MKLYHFEMEGNREMTDISDQGVLEFLDRERVTVVVN